MKNTLHRGVLRSCSEIVSHLVFQQEVTGAEPVATSLLEIHFWKKWSKILFPFFTPFLFENAHSGALQRSGHQRKVTVPCAHSMRKGVKEKWSKCFVLFF